MNTSRALAVWALLAAASCSGAQQAPVAKPAPSASSVAAVASVVPQTPPLEAAVDPDVPTGRNAQRIKELAARAETILGANLNREAILTPDGKQFVYLSNSPGIWQLFLGEVAKPEAPPQQVVKMPERAYAMTVTPDGKEVLVLTDTGADENFSIWRVNIQSKSLIELTPGKAAHRETPFVPEKASKTMVYVQREGKDKSTHVIVQPMLPTIDPKPAYTDPVPALLADVDPEGNRALLIRMNSMSESTLAVVDLKAGKAEQLYPPAGKNVMVHDASFSADGTRVLVGTDEGEDKGVVLALDPSSKKELARYVEAKPATAATSSLAVSRKGNLLAVAVDAGNHDELRLLDATTLKPVKDIPLPLGAGHMRRFSDDGKKLTLTWTTATSPLNVHVIDIGSGVMTPLRKEAPAKGATLPTVMASIENVVSFDGTKVPVNVYLPPENQRHGKLPVIVSVHGGPASSSAIRWNPMVVWQSALGFAVVEPNIRGSTGFGRAYEMADNGPKRLDALRDLEEVAKWASKQSWADSSKLVVYGGSYGGYMVLMALTRQPTLWKAGIDLVGPSNWRSFLAATSGYIGDLISKEFGTLENDGDFLDSISPLRDVAKIEAPLFVFQGKNDPRVPRQESDQVVRSLRARKVPVEYMVAMNEGHGLDRKENKVEFMARTGRFLELHVLKTGN